MQRMTRLFPALGAMILVLGLAVSAQAATRINIAVVVGDDVISSNDIAERRELIMATAGITPTVENQQKLTARITQSLIDETLQLQEARRNSLSVTDEEIKQAVDAMGNSGPTGENIREFVKKRGLSQRSLENQLRAQLAWGKVVQRKLRRNVSIAQDEVLRAQKSQAAAPGELELRLGVLELPITPGKEEQTAKLAEQMVLELKAGTDMAALPTRASGGEVLFKPPVWVPEKNLPPALAQSLRALAPGDASPAVRGMKSFQILQLVERKTAAKQVDTAEYAIKQITVAVPPKRDKATLARLHATATALRANPGSCMDETLPATALPATAKFVRARAGAMSEQQRSLVSHLDVGDVSEPQMSPDALRLVVMCEKIEPASGNLPDAEKVRQELFSEKLELEAQKHLRNLRRDAFIDIKGAHQ